MESQKIKYRLKVKKHWAAFERRRDYYLYVAKGIFRIKKLKSITDIINLFSTVSQVYSLVGIITNFINMLSNGLLYAFFRLHPSNEIIIQITFIPGLLLFLCNFINNRKTFKQISVYFEEGAYSGITSPVGWNQIELHLKADKETPPRDVEIVFVNSEINDWFRSNEIIGIKRNKEYEKELKQTIFDRDSWDDVFYPFLRQNHRTSNNNDTLFINEEMFGINSEISPTSGVVSVHRTGYYDSYLTNIIPGLQLKLRDGSCYASTKDLMPYNEYYDNGETKKELRSIEKDICRANEPGVSTLLLLDGNTFFWKQTENCKSSNNLYAPSGSGSTHWEDCRIYFNDTNGFRKAIIHGMQRELWEESYSAEGKIDEKEFMENVETRIIGYFRWLRKAGKPEFIGVTRFRTNANGKYIHDYGKIKPNPFELQKEPKRITMKTVGNLLINSNSILKYNNDNIEIGEHSVPCAMAIFFLRELCTDYCKGCHSKKDGCEKNCHHNIEEVLFPQ